jgi:hypothetical protein
MQNIGFRHVLSSTPVWVLKPEQTENKLVKGYMEEIEHYQYQKDNLIVNLKVNGDAVLIQVLSLHISGFNGDFTPLLQERVRVLSTPWLILYDSPPSNLVMSASVAALYMVLKPVYTAICSVVV